MDMNVCVATPDEAALVRDAQGFLQLMRAIEIDDAHTYQLAELKGEAARIEHLRKAIVTPFNEALDRVNQLFRAPRETLKEAEDIIKDKMVAYQREQQRLRREAQAQAEADAWTRRAELEEAFSAATGEHAEALRREADLVMVTLPAEMPAPVKGKTSSLRGSWKAECTGKLALVRFVAGHPEFLHLLEVTASALNALAKAQKDALNLPGCRVEQCLTIASRKSA